MRESFYSHFLHKALGWEKEDRKTSADPQTLKIPFLQTPPLYWVSLIGCFPMTPSDCDPGAVGRAVMRLGVHGCLRILVQWRVALWSHGFARTWGGCREAMAEALSTQAEAAGGLKALAQQNGDSGSDGSGEPLQEGLGPAAAGEQVPGSGERAQEGEAQVSGNGEQAPAPVADSGKRKKRRGTTGERVVPPPKKRRTGVSFGDEHFAETTYYFEGGLRKVRPYYFDFQTYCKGRWVGRSLLHVFSTEFRSQPLEYYEAAIRAGRLHLNEEPVQDLSIVLKVVSDGAAQNWALRKGGKVLFCCYCFPDSAYRSVRVKCW